VTPARAGTTPIALASSPRQHLIDFDVKFD
jgi:hypothetical protein